MPGQLRLNGESAITPLGLRDGIWVATADVDVRPVQPGESPESHCRYVAHHFGTGVTWVSRGTEREVRWDWPPDIWTRQPGEDTLLHPAVQAVMIWCTAT